MLQDGTATKLSSQLALPKGEFCKMYSFSLVFFLAPVSHNSSLLALS